MKAVIVGGPSPLQLQLRWCQSVECVSCEGRGGEEHFFCAYFSMLQCHVINDQCVLMDRGHLPVSVSIRSHQSVWDCGSSCVTHLALECVVGH